MLCPSAGSGNGLIFLTDSFDDGQQAIFWPFLRALSCFSFQPCFQPTSMKLLKVFVSLYRASTEVVLRNGTTTPTEALIWVPVQRQR